MSRTHILIALVLLSCACSAKNNAANSDRLTREQLMDPQSCAECHPNHVREWSGSMHAYAAEDPVFRALNARGQRETDGELGDFCVNCHAPMAVREGLTDDGLNLDEVPQHMQGVTCYFCHSVDGVEGDHNNPLTLSDDLVMRGGYSDPAPNPAHQSAYSRLHDRNELASSDLCGSCHDIVTPKGAHIERTYLEWQESLFAKTELGEPQSCGNCHMRGRDDVAADYEGVFLRRVHDHSMPGVDIAITDWPERDAQREMVQKALDPTVLPELCVYPTMGRIVVDLENVAAGHSFPSGSAPDRRAWIEVVGYSGEDVVFQSGVVNADEPVVEAAALDSQMWWLGDQLLDENGDETHFFWEAADYRSELLPAPAARSPLEPGYFDPHIVREFTDVPFVDRVTLRIHLRPIGIDILQDLVDSGDFDPALIDEMPTWTLSAGNLEWLEAAGRECVP